jgi:glycosyltransferase involved in cell wall biosynthesis
VSLGETQVKRVLVVSFFAPPQPEAAALRIQYLADYLPRFGWELVLITRPYLAKARKLSSVERKADRGLAWTIWKAKAKSFVRPFLGFYQSTFFFPDQTVFWVLPALRRALRTARRERIDAILTSHGPATEHLIGFVLATILGVPWVADYRDLWHGNPFIKWGPIHNKLALLLERFVVSRATVLTAVAGLSDQLLSVHKRRPTVIPNGFDAAIWESIPDTSPSVFRICHAGRTYGESDSIKLLLLSIARLRGQGDPVGCDAELVFYGPDSQFILDLAESCGLANVVRVCGIVDRRTALIAERGSAVLLILVGWRGDMPRMQGSKVLEYMGAGRPILALGPAESVVGEILNQSGLGELASDEQQCLNALRRMYARFIGKNIQPAVRSDWQPWTAVDLARRFAEVLDSITAPKETG